MTSRKKARSAPLGCRADLESMLGFGGQRFFVAFFFAAAFFLPPFLVSADLEDRLDSFFIALEDLASECWTGLIPFAAFLAFPEDRSEC